MQEFDFGKVFAPTTNRPYTCPGCNTKPELVKDADFNKAFYQCRNGCIFVPAASTVGEAIELWNKSVKEYIEKHAVKRESPRILDSGNRTEFATGAVRDMREGKGRMDLMPLEVVIHILDDEDVISCIANYTKSNDTEYLYFAIFKFAEVAYGNSLETMLLEVGKHFEEGAKKYGENNWQKGIEPKYYIDSAIRHYLKWRRGDKDEPHDRAFVWNIMCCIWEVDWHKKEEAKGCATCKYNGLYLARHCDDCTNASNWEAKKDIPVSPAIDDFDAPANVEPYRGPENKKGCSNCRYGDQMTDVPPCPTCYDASNWEADNEKVEEDN